MSLRSKLTYGLSYLKTLLDVDSEIKRCGDPACDKCKGTSLVNKRHGAGVEFQKCECAAKGPYFYPLEEQDGVGQKSILPSMGSKEPRKA